MRISFICTCIVGIVVRATTATAQPDSTAARFKRMSDAAEARGLAEPFKGITTNGTPRAGLFPLRSTGVSTAPVLTAARSFLAALTPPQLSRTTFAVDARRFRVSRDVTLGGNAGYGLTIA